MWQSCQAFSRRVVDINSYDEHDVEPYFYDIRSARVARVLTQHLWIKPKPKLKAPVDNAMNINVTNGKTELQTTHIISSHTKSFTTPIDATASENTVEALKEKLMLISKFMTSISHELKATRQ